MFPNLLKTCILLTPCYGLAIYLVVSLDSTYKFATIFTVLHVRWDRHTLWQALALAWLVRLGNVCGCEALAN